MNKHFDTNLIGDQVFKRLFFLPIKLEKNLELVTTKLVRVDYDDVWGIIERDLSTLKENIQMILQDLEAPLCALSPNLLIRLSVIFTVLQGWSASVKRRILKHECPNRGKR